MLSAVVAERAATVATHRSPAWFTRVVARMRVRADSLLARAQFSTLAATRAVPQVVVVALPEVRTQALLAALAVSEALAVEVEAAAVRLACTARVSLAAPRAAVTVTPTTPLRRPTGSNTAPT